MSTVTASTTAVCFDGHRFDLESGRLWSGAREVRLTPKASGVLKTLVTRAGDPVAKEELFAAVWNDTVVSDDALTSCVQELRKALDDDARRPRFIETRHRRGYRFVASLAPEPAAAAPDPPAPDLSSIAVVPFADMSPQRDLDYLCEGLAEELINALTQIDGLRVAARTASFQFREMGADVREVGRQLGVGTLLEGSVRQAGDRLRVTVQLIEAATGYHRWSRRFDAQKDDVFAVQDEIAESVAASLRGSVLSGSEKQALLRPHTGAAAYEHYLRGRQLLPRMTPVALATSTEMFERAIAIDPGYGPAWAGLAMAQATLYEWFGADENLLAAAMRASGQALALTPGLADAHVAHGFALTLSGRYDEAACEFEVAIQLNPNLFDAYYYFARASFGRGDIARSATLFAQAAHVRPEDFQSPILLGQSLDMLGRGQEATAARREGIARAERLLALNPLDARALSLGANALCDDGQAERAVEWSRRALDLQPEDPCSLLNAVCLYAHLGLKEEALTLLERVLARGCGKRDWIEHDPDFDGLRAEPRFQALLERLK